MIYTAKTRYTNKSIANEYDELRFKSWKGRIVDRLEKNCMIRGIIKLVGDKKDIILLDAPGGTGRLSNAMLKEGYRVITIDISLPMLRQAQIIHNLTNNSKFVGFVCCDLEHLPFQENSIDIVMSLRIMGHLPQYVKKRVIDEFKKVCCSGIVIMFALDNIFLKIKRWIFGVTGIKPKPAMWFPLSHRKIIAICINKGLNIIEHKDLIRFLTESRLYILRRNAQKMRRP